MIPPVPTLDPREHDAVARFLLAMLAAGDPPLLRAVLFGSKARGDFDEDSDIDVLVVCDVPPSHRDRASAAVYRLADHVSALTGVDLEPWTVCAADLQEGCRTPMLVDALEDGFPLWPRSPLRLPFTPADACFCASCLLDWVAEGGPIVRAALASGRLADAARRARDDITRLATAALLLEGDTRHRRTSSLLRFRQRFLLPRILSPRLLHPIAWAYDAFPPNGGRGVEHPPVTPAAIASAELGYQLARVMETETVPWILRRIETLSSQRYW